MSCLCSLSTVSVIQCCPCHVGTFDRARVLTHFTPTTLTVALAPVPFGSDLACDASTHAGQACWDTSWCPVLWLGHSTDLMFSDWISVDIPSLLRTTLFKPFLVWSCGLWLPPAEIWKIWHKCLFHHKFTCFLFCFLTYFFFTSVTQFMRADVIRYHLQTNLPVLTQFQHRNQSKWLISDRKWQWQSAEKQQILHTSTKFRENRASVEAFWSYLAHICSILKQKCHIFTLVYVYLTFLFCFFY